jgi:phage baseplate assembly protein V
VITLSELWRRVQNIIVTTEVVETQASGGKMLVKVKFTDDEDGETHLSDWLPVHTKNNGFMKIWLPVLVGEQVTVLRPFGSGNGGLVLPSIHHKASREIAGANAHTAIVQFSDGCTIKYDTSDGTLSVVSANKILLDCGGLRCTGDALFEKNVDVQEALHVVNDISTDASVSDAIGDLTNFSTTDGAGRA